MQWLPGGIGWNVETFTWLQITVMEAGIVGMIAWMIRKFKPLLDRMDKLVAAADQWVGNEPNEADVELARIRGGKR